MKIWSDAAQAAIESGDAISSGAIYVGCAPTPFAAWGGHGELSLDVGLAEPVVFQGVGDRSLVSASAGQLGAAAQAASVSLSGLDPASLALFDATLLRGVPVVLWRLIFNGTGSELLDYKVFTRGTVDQLPIEHTPGGMATITLMIESAARSSGRRGGRVRSDTDQRAIDPADAGLRETSFAGQKTLYWGGKRPATAMTALQAATTVLEDFFG